MGRGTGAGVRHCAAQRGSAPGVAPGVRVMVVRPGPCTGVARRRAVRVASPRRAGYTPGTGRRR